MECAVCGLRSAVGYCPECKKLLCEVCSRPCVDCAQIACQAHLQQTSSGALCRACVLKRLSAPQTATPGDPLDFESLNGGFDHAPPRDAAAEAPRTATSTEDKINTRMLTAGRKKDTPAWLTGLVGGVASWIILWPAAREGLFRDIQAYLLYAVWAVAFGTLLWTGIGLFDRRTPRHERALCLIGLLLSVGAALAAAAVRYNATR